MVHQHRLGKVAQPQVTVSHLKHQLPHSLSALLVEHLSLLFVILQTRHAPQSPACYIGGTWVPPVVRIARHNNQRTNAKTQLVGEASLQTMQGRRLRFGKRVQPTTRCPHQLTLTLARAQGLRISSEVPPQTDQCASTKRLEPTSRVGAASAGVDASVVEPRT